MSNRSIANFALMALSCLMLLGFILPALMRLQEGVLKGNGYLYYTTAYALLDLGSALLALVAAAVAVRAAGRGSRGERWRGVTVGAAGVLIVQAIIEVMIPAGFFIGVHFQ